MAGKYWPNATSDSGMYDCPKGAYWPTGTYKPIKCPVGTYNDLTGKSELSDWKDCDGGKAWLQTGIGD